MISVFVTEKLLIVNGTGLIGSQIAARLRNPYHVRLPVLYNKSVMNSDGNNDMADSEPVEPSKPRENKAFE